MISCSTSAWNINFLSSMPCAPLARLCSAGVTGVSIRGRTASVCVSPEGWTVCFNDVCSCNVERWIYLSSILPHLDCIRINCTTSKLLFTFLPLLLLFILQFLDIHVLLSSSGFFCVFCFFLKHDRILSLQPWHCSKVLAVTIQQVHW